MGSDIGVRKHSIRGKRDKASRRPTDSAVLQTAALQPTERQNHGHREDDGSDGVGQPVQEEGQSLHMVQNIYIRPSGQRRSGEQHKDKGFQGLPGLASVAPALMSRSVTSSRC